MMQRWYLASAVTMTVFVSPVLAGPGDPWEFYIGVHGGGVFGDGDYDFAGTDLDLDGDRAIFGGLAGLNYRHDIIFFGLEGDFGFATGDFDFDFFSDNQDGCGNGAWCDYNGHIRARAGVSVDSLDLFIAGGLALADGKGGDSALGGTNNDTFVGWSIGGGADFEVSDGWKVRLEFLHDDYGSRHPVKFDTTNYSSKWTDNTVRAAAIFEF
ncbi:MAG: porin family protein [Rhizobiales bacterium]|nr:porin family protein [Hyphomicrobiales bacterium]